jgi:hypothetical protein
MKRKPLDNHISRSTWHGAVTLTVLLLSFFAGHEAGAFALLGPYADWMTETNGYQLAGDIGGPMNLAACRT